MAPSRSRGSSYIPEFDPYGYSPFDDKFDGYRRPRAVIPSERAYHDDDVRHTRDYDSPSRRHSRRHGPEDDDEDDDSHRRRRGPTGATRSQSRGHRVKDNHPRRMADDNNDDDDEWDTDYDPRDKYYLSGDDDDDHDYRSSRRHQPEDRYKSREADQDGDRRRRHGHGGRQRSDSAEHGGGRGAAATAGAAAAMPAIAASRPRPMTRYSSYNGNHSARPRTRRHHRPGRRDDEATPRSRAAGPKPVERVPWEQAARCAVKAAAIAALKVHNQPGSWVGNKGARVASAALGAAVVDTFITQKHPKRRGGMRHNAIRQVADLAIGNLVMGPAMKSASHKTRH